MNIIWYSFKSQLASTVSWLFLCGASTGSATDFKANSLSLGAPKALGIGAASFAR